MVFGLLTLGILLAGTVEFHRILRLSGTAPDRLLLFIPSVLTFLTGYLITISILPLQASIAFFFVVFLAVIFQLFQKTDKVTEKAGIILLTILYLPLPLLMMNMLYFRNFDLQDPQFYLLLSLFLITWINDTFAYITGSLLGRHKLIERISPKKTWEGSLGGLLFSLIGAYALSMIFPEIDLYEWMIFSLIIVIFGTFGDLVESVLKRSAGIKESGNLIPGHGGILDRIDSILLATPAAFIYVFYILN